MKTIRFFLFGLGLFLISFSHFSQAEPWLSNRYAQNCAACHTPGRMNKEPSKRGCTLSCQGCHTNPNGGGMRNLYGKWNQSRWLKSFRSSVFIDQKVPAIANLTGASQLATVSEVGVDETSYSNQSNSNWKRIVKTEQEFLSSIPREDPYRQKRLTPVLASGDLRYMILIDTDGIPSSRGKVSNWLMATDFGVQLRPYPKYVSMVFEARFLNRPGNAALDEGFSTEARPKSAYVLVDELPYNSYVMGGLFRPMFGHYDPDHTSISSTISGLGSRALNKGISIGSAPNVPFVNFSLISPINSLATTYDKSTGVVGNLGGRFVTLGASLVGSFWISDAPDGAGNRLDRQMFAVSGGLSYARWIFNFELLRFRVEAQEGIFDEGNVYSGELRYRLWREIYALTKVGVANTALNHAEGDAHQLSLGGRAFLVAGTDIEMTWSRGYNHQIGASASRSDSVQVQAHLFF